MSVEGKRFGKTGTPIQIGGLKASGSKKVTASTALNFDSDSDRIVEIYNCTGDIAYFKLDVGANPTGAPTAIADGVGVVMSKSVSRPFLLPADCRILSNEDVLIVPLDKEDA